MKFKFLIILSLFLVIACKEQNKTENNNAYKGFSSWLPAAKWEDALLTGNGTIGAMLMGNPFEETIILNHALLFLPNDLPVTPPNMAAHLDKIRQLSFAGKWEEVAELGVKIWEDAGYGPKKWTDPYVPAANININMPGSNVENYKRSVNFETAEAIIEWEDKNGRFTRKTFASRADGILVTQISGTGKINADIKIGKHPHTWEQNSFIQSLIAKSETTSPNEQILQYHCEYGKPHVYSPKGYDAIMKVVVTEGNIATNANNIKVNNAKEVIILTSIAPNKELNQSIVDSLINKINNIEIDYNSLLERQKQTHGQLYNRMSLNLFPTDEEKNMTSETMVLKAREKSTPGLVQRQFEAARYHILCATGTNPPNLQGIWSGTWTPPWSSDFTHDGNVEVAISHFLNGNMPEPLLAYFDYHERMLPFYKTNAKQLYGTRGIHIPSHTSSNGFNNHYGKTWCLEYWNGGAAWAASYFYDYFLYTSDTTFLKERAFPFMNEALLFWEDFLITGENGKYISVPSYSPENNPLEHPFQNCINATMDFALIKELTRNWIASAQILNLPKEQIEVKIKMLELIPEYEVSEDGVIKEWQWPGFTDNQTHRHVSHLYGLYENPDLDILNSEKLKKAATQTIQKRMKIRKQHHGGEMAFGMCHLGNSAVNIGDKETATEVMEYLSRFYWTNSMATTHNPGNLFNMDISGGYPSLVARMLVNSRPGQIDIFPAKPDYWEKGEAKGIMCRGNIEIEKISWSLTNVVIELKSSTNQSILLNPSFKGNVKKFKFNGEKLMNYPTGEIPIELKRGETTKIEWSL